MTDVRRILVCGYYGFANAGDEAILSALLDDIRTTHPEAAVTVMSGRPTATTADHGGVEAIHWQDLAAMVTVAREADLMVLGGGGLFQDHHRFEEDRILTPDHGTIGYYAGFALLARLSGTPLSIFGVGVGPLTTEAGQRWTRIAFQHCSAASVRDNESRQLLESIGVDVDGVAVSADPAWVFHSANRAVAESILQLEHAPEAPRTIAVSVRPWDEYRWAEALAEGLDRLANDDTRILFVPFQDSLYSHENDARASVEVLRRMKRGERAAIIRGGYSVEERASIIAISDLLIGMRLHSVIFGLGAEVPTVALAYDPKVSQVMAEAGVSDACTDLAAVTADWLVSTARVVADMDPSKGVARMRQRATANREVLLSSHPQPDLTPEAVEWIGWLLTSHALTGGEAVSQARRLEAENALLQEQHQYDLIAQENLERQREELAGTKAVRLMNSYWRVREEFGEAAQKLGKRAPDSLKPALSRLAGGPEEEQVPVYQDPRAIEAAEAQLKEVFAQNPEVPGVVIYPASIGWNVSLFQRPQQMALAFARLGYLVLYGVFAREGIGDRIEQRAPRLYLFPEGWAMTEAISRIPDPITPAYVYNFAWTKRLSDPRVIFEHIDELEVFTTTHTIKDLRTWYDEAVDGAEMVVASARDLLHAVEGRRPDAFLCPNGVDYRHFADYAEGEPPEDIADIAGGRRPVVGYYGALAEWVDYPLIRKSATELSDFEFVFIGPDYDGSISAHTEVFGLQNVRWLGVKDYSELPAYLHYFDVATIPFVVNEVTHSVSPIKLFEYMAGGRPVVTTNLRECAHYEAVQVAVGPDEYVAELRRAALDLRHDTDHLALLRRTARANTWEMRVGTLVDALARSGRL